MNFTREQAKQLLNADLNNVVVKVTKGGVMTRRQIARIESVAAGGSPLDNAFVSTHRELAEALGVARETLYVWLRDPRCPGRTESQTFDVGAWLCYARYRKGRNVELRFFSDWMKPIDQARWILRENQKLLDRGVKPDAEPEPANPRRTKRDRKKE